MSRRKRVDPFDEGSLKVIYEKFFRKIVELYCPADKTHKEFLEDLFDIDHRHIINMVAKRDFLMPGLLCVSGNVKIQGLGYRQVKAGTSVLVRVDDRFPQEVHVDFFAGQGGAENVYSLTRNEWFWVEQHLENPDNDQIKH